ncbi:hypothetical protein PVAND_015785 [Polypedilum vanderplanki]|uniref:Uncharacterized protein n=1 Tax=Polypedilum vanderplanki TaxID=319348 RepID=A0A9J6BDZ5_POLVA|nr:hypothetical protein PVAND_015785 [Polypedilum vanderplanki]
MQLIISLCSAGCSGCEISKITIARSLRFFVFDLCYRIIPERLMNNHYKFIKNLKINILKIMPKRKAKPLTLKGEKKRIDSSQQKRRLNPEYLHNESERDKSTQQKRREDPEYLAHQLSRDNSTWRSRRELIKCIQIVNYSFI